MNWLDPALLLQAALLLLCVLAFFYDLLSDRWDRRLKVEPWRVRGVDFSHFVWILLLAFFIGQFAGAELVPRLDGVLGAPQEKWRLVAGAMALHLPWFVVLLVGIRAFPRQFPTPLVFQPMAARQLLLRSLIYLFAAAPVMLAVRVLWNEILAFWERRDLGIDLVPQAFVEILRDETSPVLILLLGISALVLAPVTEELIFRAGLYRFFKGRMRPAAALAFSSLLFALLHLNLLHFLPLFALGALLVRSYEKTGNIFVPIGFHAAFNLVTFVSLLLAGPAEAGEVPLPGLAAATLANILPGW